MTYPPPPQGGPWEQPGWQGQQPGWGAPQPGWPGQPQPDNYLVWAILSTLFCCLPVGIVSIVYSSKVAGLWAQGRYGEAQAAANSAKKWAIASAIAWVGVVVAYLLFMLVMFAIGSTVHNISPSPTTSYYYHHY